MTEQAKVLIIDDEPIARITLEALLSAEDYQLHFAEDGMEGLALVANLRPDVVLLDVMMPGMNGFDVCRAIRVMEMVSEVPILLITALDDRESRLEGLRAGADDFISKPFDSIELMARLHGIVRLNRYRRIAEQRRLLENLHQELLLSYDKTIEGWSRALDLRDKETEGHSLRVTEMTVELARLAGMDSETLRHIWRGALLHDIGKLGITDAILHKPDQLTPQEWDIMRLHPVYAYEWLSQIPYLRPALDIPYCHHEKWDGSGYPRGLKGEEIPLPARLFAVVDVWDALTSNRPYREAMPPEEAYRYILSQSGSHFDPQVVLIFSRYLTLAGKLPQAVLAGE